MNGVATQSLEGGKERWGWTFSLIPLTSVLSHVGERRHISKGVSATPRLRVVEIGFYRNIFENLVYYI